MRSRNVVFFRIFCRCFGRFRYHSLLYILATHFLLVYTMKGPLALLASFLVVGVLFQLRVRTSTKRENHRQLRGNVSIDPDYSSMIPPALPPQRRQGRRLVESGGLVRFAWGIVSQPEDEDLREGLRRTYLNDPRVCVLGENAPLDTSCQIAYTFVLPLEDLQDGHSLAASPADITYLPVSDRLTLVSSWFRSAADADVDYVAKVDATTLVFTEKFLEMAQDVLGLPSMHRVIGGVPKDRWDCGGFSKWKCRQMHPSYMSSTLYFLSTDLAAGVPLNMDDQEPYRLANWLVNASPQLPTMQVTIKPSHGLWESQGATVSSVSLQERWDYLQSQQFSRHLLQPNEDTVPRWNGTSLLDEFYRRIPWRFIPNSWTRFDLP